MQELNSVPVSNVGTLEVQESALDIQQHRLGP
jgi:hypothetical protein